jgi:hypothetical protein
LEMIALKVKLIKLKIKNKQNFKGWICQEVIIIGG